MIVTTVLRTLGIVASALAEPAEELSRLTATI